MKGRVNSVQVYFNAFIIQLVAAVEEAVLRQVSAVIDHTFGRESKRIDGSTETSVYLPVKKRKPRAKQLCSVPGCEGVAAPIFGMVCGKHRDVAKSKIARYRAERKETKKLSILRARKSFK